MNGQKKEVAERVGFEPSETPIENNKLLKFQHRHVPCQPPRLPAFGSRFGSRSSRRNRTAEVPLERQVKAARRGQLHRMMEFKCPHLAHGAQRRRSIV
jgi:hypothetical protein